MWRSAAKYPWYRQRFELAGFKVEPIDIRENGKAIDRVNMYASCKLIPPHRADDSLARREGCLDARSGPRDIFTNYIVISIKAEKRRYEADTRSGTA